MDGGGESRYFGHGKSELPIKYVHREVIYAAGCTSLEFRDEV